jgi:hypothetical protein
MKKMRRIILIFDATIHRYAFDALYELPSIHPRFILAGFLILPLAID